MARRFTKDGIGRGEFIKEYSQKEPEALAALLFDERDKNRVQSEEIGKLSHDAAKAEIFAEANKNLKELLEKSGHGIKRYIVTTEYCECGDEDEGYRCAYSDGCKGWAPSKSVDMFYFYSIAIDDGRLHAVDAHFQNCDFYIVSIVDDETGCVIWER